MPSYLSVASFFAHSLLITNPPTNPQILKISFGESFFPIIASFGKNLEMPSGLFMSFSKRINGLETIAID